MTKTADHDIEHLPNFLVIGGVKCGTTWLHRTLSRHKNIFLPQKKELRFFNVNWKQGMDWYARHFVGAEADYRGEVSPEYMLTRKSAKRIYKTLPNAKLIAVIRDPVDRAYSHYRMHCRKGSVKLENIEDNIFSDFFIEPGLYGENLRPFFELFKNDQIYVDKFENLKDRPDKFIDDICSFLGTDGLSKNHIPSKKYNSGQRNIRLPYIYSKTQEILRRWSGNNMIAGMIGPIKESFIGQMVVWALSGDTFPPLDDGLRRRLYEIYERDIRETESLVEGLSLQSWSPSVPNQQ